MSKQMLQILLVEDDDVDAEALLRAFRKQRLIIASLTVVKNGLEALDLLRGLHVSNDPTRPHLVLLDINMPQMNGIEFLTEL
ncbi:MAG: response regulator, partial [Caldilineaceae bacterium]|nr:response regulator [Caldilineaceae bacterium]